MHQPDERAELRAALAEALRYDDLVLLEPYLDHPRELEASVLGNSRADLVAYGPGEVVPGREFYDYVAKYRSDESAHDRPGRPGPRAGGGHPRRRREVYLAIGASGFARVDLLLSAGRHPLHLRDQHHPGLHAHQPLPAPVRPGRLRLRGTCERIVELALERAAGAAARGA